MAEDRILRCKDCGQQFTFTVGEQEFYAQKGFENDPVRCAPCRKTKKTQRTAIGATRFRDLGENYGSGGILRSSYGRDRDY